MTARLATSLVVGALIRRTQAQGGHAVVVARGDETAGGILLQCLEKGRITALCEHILDTDGTYAWQSIGPQDIDNTVELDHYIAKRRRFDPDLWVIELDVPNAQRLAAEITSRA
jgi:hypothetical protein